MPKQINNILYQSMMYIVRLHALNVAIEQHYSITKEHIQIKDNPKVL